MVECTKNILNEWEIPQDKISAVVTDGGPNIVGAVKKLFGNEKHLYCFAHILNLIVMKSLDDDKNLKLTAAIDQLKKIVTWFHQSVVAADELKKLTPLKLKQSVPTRWNSVLTMIDRYIEISDKVTGILVKTPKSPELISADQLQLLQEVASALRVFNEVTVRIQSETSVTISQIIPYAHYILSHINKQNAETLSGKLFLARLKETATSKLQGIEQVNIATCATILDPRFKRAHFESPIAAARGI